MIRSTVDAAVVVWSVPKTRWPVSAAVSAVPIVSMSRISPTRITSGSWRSAALSAIAIETAETGHLVFGTLHTTTAASTVDRVIDQFPSDRQAQIRIMLSESLKGVIAQTLVPTADGQGRCVAAEVLVPTPGVRNLIREGKTHQIYSTLQTGNQFGMQTMDSALAQLVREQKITRELAEARSSTPEELRRLMGTVRVA